MSACLKLATTSKFKPGGEEALQKLGAALVRNLGSGNHWMRLVRLIDWVLEFQSGGPVGCLLVSKPGRSWGLSFAVIGLGNSVLSVIVVSTVV